MREMAQCPKVFCVPKSCSLELWCLARMVPKFTTSDSPEGRLSQIWLVLPTRDVEDVGKERSLAKSGIDFIEEFIEGQ